MTSDPIDWDSIKRRIAAAIEANERALSPSPEQIRQILEDRARALATPAEAEPADTQFREVLLFELSDDTYAIEAGYVCEVVLIKDLAPVPRSPDHLAGVQDLRGQLLPVFDLRPLLGLAIDVSATSPCAVVCGQDEAEFAILADEAREVERVPLDKLTEMATSGHSIHPSWIRGSLGDRMIVLDGAALLKEPRFFVA